MRIKPKQYARALYESVCDAKSAEVKIVIEKFVKYIVANNDTHKLDKIISSFYDIWNLKKGIKDLHIASSRYLDKTTIKSIEEYVRDVSNSAEVETTEKIDKKLLGGVIIQYGDKVIDASLKSRIVSLKDSLKR